MDSISFLCTASVRSKAVIQLVLFHLFVVYPCVCVCVCVCACVCVCVTGPSGCGVFGPF